MKFCPEKKKKYSKNCYKNGHNLTQCRYDNITRKPKSTIRQAQLEDTVNKDLRKYVTVDIFNNSIKLQLDSGSDISIINWCTWRKLNEPTLLKTEKTATTEVFEDSIIATLKTNLRNQKQCSQEKSSPSSINTFHGK